MMTHPSSPTHCFSHLLVTPEGLYPQTDRLELRTHLIELLDIPPCPDEVFRHDLACVLHTNVI
jgi:hypothetical protein